MTSRYSFFVVGLGVSVLEVLVRFAEAFSTFSDDAVLLVASFGLEISPGSESRDEGRFILEDRLKQLAFGSSCTSFGLRPRLAFSSILTGSALSASFGLFPAQWEKCQNFGA